MKRIAICNCTSLKQNYVCSIEEMYSRSPAFRARRDFFNKAYDDWYVFGIEIKHRTEIIEPYDDGTLAPYSTHMKPGTFINPATHEEKERANKQLAELINKGYIIDLHIAKAHWNLIYKENRAKVNYIKQPRGNNSIKLTYEKATEMLDNYSLNECLEFISKKKTTKYPEYDKWFYHPVHGKFYGKAYNLYKKYPENNSAGLFRASVGIFTHHKGWVIDESLLDKLYQTDSGQWRLKKRATN